MATEGFFNGLLDLVRGAVIRSAMIQEKSW